jgi:hypothetical protein
MNLPVNRYSLHSVAISAATDRNEFLTPFNSKFTVILNNRQVKGIETERDLNFL